MDMIISFTSFSDIGANFCRIGMSFVVGVYGLISSNCFLMVRILFRKKSANSSANSTLDFPSGNGFDFALPVIWPMMLYSCLVSPLAPITSDRMLFLFFACTVRL